MRLGKNAKKLVSERWPFLVVCLFVAFLSLPIGTCAASSVIPSSLIPPYAEASINNYNICDGEDPNDDEMLCTIPSGDQITWIGDSYSVGAQSIIESEFPGISFGGSVDDPDSYIQSCKFVAREGCNGNPTNPSGLDVLGRIISDGDLKPYLVFALGTNGGWSSSDVDGFRDAMEGHDDTIVIFVNSKTPNNNFAESNRILKDLADSSDKYYLADWARAEKDEWFADGIHPSQGDGYSVWVDTIKSTIPVNCSAGLVPEDTNEGMVWNYFVRAGIDGVSNNPAVIAGIMGNFKLESNFDPFVVSGSGYHGIHQTQDQSFIDAINNAELGQYWGNSSSASAEDIKEAIRIELDWIKDNNTRFKSGGEAYNFVDNLSRVDENKPENYSDLFLVAVEGAVGSAVPSAAEPLIDSGAMALEDEYFASANSGYAHQYQAAATRREYARDIYDRLASGGTPPSGTNSDYSSTEGLSGNGHIKYDMEDNDIETLARFAIWKAGKEGKEYADVLSKILDDFEASPGARKGDSDELVKYVKESDEYSSFESDSDATSLRLDSTQLRKAKEIIIDGLRTTSSAQAETVSNRKSVNCPNKNRRGAGAEEIAKVAALMSWPVQNWQTSADDFESNRVGKCNGGSGWVSYVYDTEPCRSNPRDLYKNNLNPTGGLYGYMDCGTFVSSVLSYLDLIDDTIRSGGQSGYGKNLRASSDWTEITNEGVGSMKPGDVLWNGLPSDGGNGVDGHVMIFVGDTYGGGFGNVAAASARTRVGEIENIYHDDSWYIFRYVGNKLGGGGYVGDGLTESEANKLAFNYNTNKGNWSGYPNNIKVAQSGNYCHSDAFNTCASDYSNCTLFSAFFAEMFWGVAQRGWPEGKAVVNDLKNLGYSTGTEPKPFAIFSTTTFHGDNHTGVVVAVDGDKIATVEAGYPNLNATYFDFQSISGHNIEFAYPDNVDTEKLTEFINR